MNRWRKGAFCSVCIFHNKKMDVYLIKYFLYAYGSFIAYVTDVLSWVLSICCMPIETLRLQELYSIGYRCTFMDGY